MATNKYHPQDAAYEMLDLRTGDRRMGSIKGMKLTRDEHLTINCGGEVIYKGTRIRHASWQLLSMQARFLYKLKPTEVNDGN